MKTIGIILAAGKGKRMKSHVPKVFHPVSGRPMVLLVFEALTNAGVDEIIVVASSETDRFKKFLPESIKIVVQDVPKGTGHAVLCAKQILSDFKGRLIVACADMPLVEADTIKRLIKQHENEKAACAILTGDLDNPKGYGRILRDDKDNVMGIVEDTDTKKGEEKVCEVNSGMYCFNSKELFVSLSKIRKDNKQGEYYLTDVVELLVKKKRKVRAIKAKDTTEIFGINSREDLAAANRIMNQRVLKRHMEQGVTIIDPLTTYIDTRVKIGMDTVIYPMTVIEGDVVIGEGCSVGPFAHLRDKTVLKDKAEIGNFVEVKKSVIGSHTKAKHLTYLGDAVLGDNVNIGAGTITANYDGKNKYQTVIKDRVFIGSNTTLVAPVTIGDGAITGAGSVVLKGRHVPPDTIVVGVPARQLKKTEKGS